MLDNYSYYRMPDYKKTEQLFKENPEIEKRYQWEDLPPRYRKFSNGRKYPVREVLQIIRARRPDFSEWLKSRGRIVGLDKLGNEVEHSFTDPEMYFTPQTKYELKPKDPKNPDGLKERVCVEAGINEAVAETIRYILPFNAKNFDSLFEQRLGKSAASVSLTILEEGSTERPRQITNHEKFRNTPFEDLWVDATTPKFKLDRSYKDNLEGSHIK